MRLLVRRRRRPSGRHLPGWPVRLLCLALAAPLLLAPARAATSSAPLALPAAVDGEPLPSLAPVLDRVRPAVVNISTRAASRGGPSGGNPLREDPFFRRYFEQREPRGQRLPQSRGSGVIVDAGEGLVVTNSHVIDGAASVVVTLADGEEHEAALVGNDPLADIALLRIPADGLVELPWADSDELRVGDFCIAIGNPFGLGQTVTSGIVSALGRSGLGIEEFEDFIQTDASINPGNSGGALVNLRGELIGINTAIVGPSGGNVGIGFAIPANMAADLAAQLLEHGRVRRGALGVSALPLTPALAARLGADVHHGVVVERVRQGSPAERAGLRLGDIIVAIDGRKVRDVDAVRNRIGLVRVGQRLRLDLVRDGSPLEIDVTVAELPPASPSLVGVRFVEGRLRDGRAFVAVEAVASGSAAERAGLREGDVVLAIGRRAVDSLDALETLAERTEGALQLLVQRGRERRYVRIG